MAGQGAGAKIRRWWWNVNDWKVPEDRGWGKRGWNNGQSGARANQVREVRSR